MDEEAKKRIMKTQAPKSGGQIPKKSFASRAQSAADRNSSRHTVQTGNDKSGSSIAMAIGAAAVLLGVIILYNIL